MPLPGPEFHTMCTFQSRRLALGGEAKASPSGKASCGAACGHGSDAAPKTACVEPAAASVDEAQPQGISPKLLGSAVGVAGAAGAAADAKRASRSRPLSKLRRGDSAAAGRWEARADGGRGGAEEGVGGMRTGEPSQHEAEKERDAATGDPATGIMSLGLERVLQPLATAGPPNSSGRPPVPCAAPSSLPSSLPSPSPLPSKSRLLPISDSKSPVASTGVPACNSATCNLAPSSPPTQRPGGSPKHAAGGTLAGAARAAAWARCAAA